MDGSPLLKLFLFFSFLFLASCYNQEQKMAIKYEEPKSGIRRVFTMSFPNKPGALVYTFSVPTALIGFHDYLATGTLTASRMENGIELSSLFTGSDWTWKYKCDTLENNSKVISNDGSLDLFIKELESIASDTCFLYDYGSPYNAFSASLYFIGNNGALRHINFDGSRCALAEKEADKTKLESLEYKIQTFFRNSGVWNKYGGRDWRGLHNVKKDKGKLLDTIYFKQHLMDARLLESVNIFYPLDSLSVSNYAFFINKIETLTYYQAVLSGNSVKYVKHIREYKNEEFIDNDTASFNEFLHKLSNYDYDEYEVENALCPYDKLSQIIYWNDETFNLIPFECITDRQKIYWIDKRIREWFESKFSRSGL